MEMDVLTVKQIPVRSSKHVQEWVMIAVGNSNLVGEGLVVRERILVGVRRIVVASWLVVALTRTNFEELRCWRLLVHWTVEAYPKSKGMEQSNEYIEHKKNMARIGFWMIENKPVHGKWRLLHRWQRGKMLLSFLRFFFWDVKNNTELK